MNTLKFVDVSKTPHRHRSEGQNLDEAHALFSKRMRVPRRYVSLPDMHSMTPTQPHPKSQLELMVKVSFRGLKWVIKTTGAAGKGYAGIKDGGGLAGSSRPGGSRHVTAKHAWHLEAEAGALAAFGHGWAVQYSQPSAGMPACSGKDKIHKPNVVKTNINSSVGIWLSMARRCVGKTLSATRCARYTLAI